MNLAEFLLLLAVFALGGITTYEDAKYKKIRNKWIILALAYSLVVYSAFIIASWYNGTQISTVYFTEFSLNLLFALLAGVVIWLGGLWPAGDAKLFFAFAALIPLSFYRFGYVSHFPAYAILLNTFVPFFIFYTLKVLIKTKTKEKIEILKEMFSPQNLIRMILFVFAFYWLLVHIARYVPLLSNVFMTVVVLFLILFLVRYIFGISYVYVALVVSTVELVIDYETIFTMSYLKSFLMILFLFIFLRYFVLHLTYRLFAEPKYIENLEAGMIPAENFVERDGSYNKIRILPISFISSLIEKLEGKPLFEHVSEGLSKQDVKRVKRLHSAGDIKDHALRIYQTMSFAPFLFFGVFVTIICRGDFLTLARVLLEKFI